MPYFYRNNIKYSGGSDSVDLTMAEYKELEANGKVVQDITYYIIDADENIPSRPNLLINSNFANPVNQRGIIGDTWNKHMSYGLDKWFVQVSNDGLIGDTYEIDLTNRKVSQNDGYISIFTKSGQIRTHLTQRIEFPASYKGKTVTLSIRARCTKDSYLTFNICDGNLKYYVATFKGTGEFEVYTLTANIETDLNHINFGIGNCDPQTLAYTPLTVDTTLDIEWAKLEVGNYATPYAPRLYAEELGLCRRYFDVDYTQVSPYHVGTDIIIFPVLLQSKMRVVPTITLKSVDIYRNNEIIQGFTAEVNSWNGETFNLTLTKTNHGLYFNDCITAVVRYEADAELY